MNNSLTLVGRVGQKPVKKTIGNTTVVTFSVAVKEFRKGDEDKVLWINVEAWNGVGDRVLPIITRGREVVVSGRLAVSSYSKTRDDGTVVEVSKPVLKLGSVHLCGRKPETASE